MNQPRLTFDEAKHEYRYKGEVVLSVTQILTRANPGAMAFCTQEGLDRGTAVHAEIARWLSGDWQDCQPTGYLAQAVKFLEDVNACVIDFEKIVMHRDLRYCGRIDLVCRINGLTFLLDWKTNTIPESAGPQTAGYAAAWNSTRKRNRIDKRGAVLLTPDRYRLVELSDPMDWGDFLRRCAP